MSGPQRFESRGKFAATPEALWPLVGDTPTLNRAIGLPPIEYELTPLPTGGSRAEAMIRMFGITLARWTEHPFLWREPYGWMAFRDFHGGPFERFVGGVDMVREGDRTDVRVFAEITPRNLLGRLILKTGFGQQNVEKIVKQVGLFDAYLLGHGRDPFPTLAPKTAPPDRVWEVAGRLMQAGCPQALVDRLCEHVASARDEEVERMRPFELADRWGEDRRTALGVFLRATEAGLLTMTWDVLCPGCRVGKGDVRTLRDLRAEAHCEACNIVFDASFDQLVEVRFAPAPAIRSVTLREFCLGGPMRTPHIAAQVPLQPGERRTVLARLDPGLYRLRAGGSKGAASLQVAGEGDAGAVAVTVSSDDLSPRHATVTSGELMLEAVNTLDVPTALVVEDSQWPDTVATAAIVSTMPEFRDLFSSEVLAPGLQLGVSRLAFLFTDLTGSTALYQRVGQARAFRIVQDQFALLGEAIASHNGAIVKTIGDAVMATFPSGGDALAAGLAIQRAIRQLDLRGEADPSTLVRVGIHQGPCVAVTANERLDYFGTTVNIASRVEHEAQGGEVAATAEVCESVDAQAVLAGERVHAEMTTARLKGIDEPVRLYRLRVEDVHRR
ncbi:MAG: adenylate/guanylate cyclase domain-containing protein [Chloroflexi bacterium]|nr:adenylate/guanylate cyclase domain-containing protein [Chloroflexota bacterium]